MVPKCAIAHGSNTVGTAVFNPHKKVSKTHFNIIVSFPSKLCISDIYNFLQLVKLSSYVANVTVFQFRRTSVGLGVKYSDTKFLLRSQVGTDF
jgi:hypothetical protein